MQPPLRTAIVRERGSSKPSLPHSLQPHPHHPAPSILTHIHPSVQLPAPHSLSPSHQLLLLLHQVAVLLLSPLHLRVRSNAHFPLPMVPFSPLPLSSSLIMLVPQRMVYDWMPSSVAINLTTMVFKIGLAFPLMIISPQTQSQTQTQTQALIPNCQHPYSYRQ